jgi:hypothetical protein
MALDIIWRWAEVQGEAIEEHDCDVDARVTGGDHASA